MKGVGGMGRRPPRKESNKKSYQAELSVASHGRGSQIHSGKVLSDARGSKNHFIHKCSYRKGCHIHLHDILSYMTPARDPKHLFKFTLLGNISSEDLADATWLGYLGGGLMDEGSWRRNVTPYTGTQNVMG